MSLGAKLAWDCACDLGEGAVWSVAQQALFFVDIHAGTVRMLAPQDGTRAQWVLPQRVGWLVPRRAGGWIAGLQQGVVALALAPDGRSEITWLHRLHPEDSELRLNDGKADRWGRLWFGSMHNRMVPPAQGCLYRWQAGEAPAVVDTGYGVANGPAISPDGSRLYHTDSPRRTIYVFDLAPDGALTNKRVWLTFERDEGFPDGMNFDADGHLWIAHWGGGCVTQRDAQGRVLQRIALPAAQVSNVAFGGARMQDLYITTARNGLDADALAPTPAAGGLFVVHGAGQGLAPQAFAG